MVDMAESYIKMIGSNRGRRGIRGLYDMTQADISAVTGNPYGAQDYYVDGNRSTTSGDGKSWETAFQSLSEAITASNVTIAASANRWWARRNRIFCCGDQELTEDLTIFPEKCDVIGIGHDVVSMPRITGTHVIAAVATGKAYGTRFFNCGFMNDDAGPTVHLVAAEMGVQFHGCYFWPAAAGSTHCIQLATGNAHFEMHNCRIMENVTAPGTGIFAECIKISGVAQHDMLISNNIMYGTEGIHIEAGTGGYNTIIQYNLIRATVLTIKDTAGLAIVRGNHLITAEDANTITAAITATADLAVDNVITHSGTDMSESYPLLKTT